MTTPSATADLATALQRDTRFVAAILFGSVAHGRARPDSDVDIAVLYADPAARNSVDHDFLTTLGQLGMAARRDVHLVDLEQADCGFRRRIFATGTTLFDRSDGRLRKLLASTLIEYFDWAYARSVIDMAQRRQLGLTERHG